ncbi:MAG: serine hydrolase [Nitrolancea sp.]
MRRGLVAAFLVLALFASGLMASSANPESSAQVGATRATSPSTSTGAIQSPATPGSSVSFTAVSTWDGLRGELTALVAGWGGQNAVSVTDLQAGQTISINGARPQLAACTIKIPMMMVVAHDIEAGRYTAAEVEPYVLSAMGPSNTAPARELIRLAGDGDIGVGINRINELMQSLGMTHSVIAHPPGYSWESYGYGDENLLTSDDLNLLLTKLYRGEALSPWATNYVLWSMSLAPDWVNQSLGGPLPDDVTLYHKFGQLYDPENTWNDGGIAEFKRNGTTYAYAITYLGSYDSSWQSSYTHAYQASATAWRYFNAVYTGDQPGSLPDVRYFPETGFSLGGGFLRYWQNFGGLATFGYPISGEIQERNPADGKTYAVQYFERARFEWHPGAWPERYDVELGLLGVTVANQNGLTGTAPFRPVLAGSDASCTYFAATGHRLCFGFRDFWQAHGGLAILGYPISEEFVENGYTVQYFERQCLEYHPENSDPWTVLGGLLGRQVWNASHQ